MADALGPQRHRATLGAGVAALEQDQAVGGQHAQRRARVGQAHGARRDLHQRARQRRGRGVRAQPPKDHQRLARPQAGGGQLHHGLLLISLVQAHALGEHRRPREVEQLDELILGGVAQPIPVGVAPGQLAGDGGQDLVQHQVAPIGQVGLGAALRGGLGHSGGVL
jgi:hypothetical protein